MLMMDTLSNDMLNESAFEIANSMIQAEIGLNHVPHLIDSVGSPVYRPQIDFSDEDLAINPSWIHQLQTPSTSNENNNTRHRRRKATQPQRLVYCDPSLEDANPPTHLDELEILNGKQVLPEENTAEIKQPLEPTQRCKGKKTRGSGKTCQICGLTLYNSQALKNHISRIHEKIERKFKCELCDKSYFSKSELKQHGTVHNKDRNFCCVECGKSFTAKHHLVRHAKTHTGLKPFKCEICDKQLSDKTGFIAHVRNHRGERPFSCTFCEKTYTIKRHLTTHLKIHSAIRPFQCEVEGCGKTFRSRSNFRMHKDTHAGIKRWSCQVCGRQFLSQGNMAKHVRRHVGVKRFPCDSCDKSFIEKQELRNHQRVHTKSKDKQEHDDQGNVFAELKPAKVSESVENLIDGVLISVFDQSCQPASVSSSQDGSNFVLSSSSTSSFSLESNTVTSTSGVLGDLNSATSSIFNNCTLCSNYYPSPQSLKMHLIEYHRVEVDRIN